MRPSPIHSIATRLTRLLCATCIPLLACTACGNIITTAVYGNSGYERTEDGDLLIHVLPCGQPLTEVTFSAHDSLANENLWTNKVEAVYRNDAADGTPFTINVSDPAGAETTPGWTLVSGDPIPLERDRRVAIIAPLPDDAEVRGGNLWMGTLLDYPVGDVLFDPINDDPAPTKFRTDPAEEYSEVALTSHDDFLNKCDTFYNPAPPPR